MHDKSQKTSSGALKGVHLKDNMIYLILYIMLTIFKQPQMSVPTFGTNTKYK